jgi:hypothetical protein
VEVRPHERSASLVWPSRSAKASKQKLFDMSEVVRFLNQRAAKARQLAETLSNEEAVATLLKLAEQYDTLAREKAEKEGKETWH